MKVIIATSSGQTPAAKKLILKAIWYTYGGKKIELNNHNKEFDIDVAKGDKIGIIQTPAAINLLHADDPEIKFKISSAELDSFLLKSKPYTGKIGDVQVSTAIEPEPAKVKTVKTKVTEPSIDTTDLKEGTVLTAQVDGKSIKCSVAEDFMGGDRVRVIPQSGELKGRAIFVKIVAVEKIFKSKPVEEPVATIKDIKKPPAKVEPPKPELTPAAIKKLGVEKIKSYAIKAGDLVYYQFSERDTRRVSVLEVNLKTGFIVVENGSKKQSVPAKDIVSKFDKGVTVVDLGA